MGSTTFSTAGTLSPLSPAALDAAIRARDGLPLVRARAERAARGAALGLRVAYVGGSVTAQRDGWRPAFHAWLERALPAPLGHDMKCAAIGNCGSKVLAFVLNDWVLPDERPPDLVLIETAINDGDALLESGGDETSIRRALEGLVRGVRLTAPTAELLLVVSHLRTDLPQARRSGTLAWVNGDVAGAERVYSESVPAIHEQVASHYGIPSVNITRALRGLPPTTLDALFRDDCHTTPAGAAVVASIVAACVQKSIAAAAARPPLPPPLDPLHWAGGRAHHIARSDLHLATDAAGAPLHTSQFWDVDPLTGARGQWWLLAPEGDDALVINFAGTSLALLTHVGPDAGVVRCKVTPACGGAPIVSRHVLFDQWAYYYRLSVVVLAEGLNPGQYQARVNLEQEPPDRSIAKRELQPAVAGPLRLWLMHALVLNSAAYAGNTLTAQAHADSRAAAAEQPDAERVVASQRQPAAACIATNSMVAC